MAYEWYKPVRSSVGDKFTLKCGTMVEVVEVLDGDRVKVRDCIGTEVETWGVFLRAGNLTWKGKTCGKPRTSSRKFSAAHMLQVCFDKHDGRYSYEESDFVRTKDKIKITCPKHGQFLQRVREHMQGAGCTKCAADAHRHDKEDFIRLTEQQHGEWYTFDDLDYKGQKEPVTITCPDHGNFTQKGAIFLYGKGCPDCPSETYTDKPSVLYVLECNGLTKVGITSNIDDRLGKIRRESRQRFEILKLYDFDNWYAARDAETLTLRYLRTRYRNPTYSFTGSTEAFEDVFLAELLNFIEEDVLTYFPADSPLFRGPRHYHATSSF